MRELFDVLESKGLVSEVDTMRIENLSAKELLKLYEHVYGGVFDSQEQRAASRADTPLALDPFTFFAGASMRGDSGCEDPLCRMRKIDFLGRYAALYANEVTVPLPLTHPDKLGGVAKARALLLRSATTLLRLRPLITHGTIKPTVMRTTHCEHEIQWVKQMHALIYDLAEHAAKESLTRFDLLYLLPEKAPTGRATIYVEGPRDFLEHGSLVVLFDESPNWRCKTWKYDRKGRTELRRNRKLWFVQRIFDEIASNTSFYLAYGLRQNARFLTDLPGEAFVLNWLTGDEQLSATTSAMELLTHAVPILADLPIATLLRIRREERDAFESYRGVITRIASDTLAQTNRLSKKEAQEMFKALIEPEIASLRKEIRFERRRQRKRITGGLATLAAAVAIGAFGDLPVAIGGTLAGAAAVAGGRLLGKAGEVACEHGANLRQRSDLYFLVRLLQEERAD